MTRVVSGAGAEDNAGDGTDGDEIKDSIAYLLWSLLKSEEFTLDPADLVNDDRDTGSNSTRKLAVNLSREIGRSKDETDHRGRWKGSDRQQDQYADTTIPHVDAIVAATLCVGGPIAYFVRDDSGVSSDWILEHVTPHMFAANIPRQVCIVLGRALLWKVWEAAHGDLGARNRLEAGTNPVWRANIGVTGIDAELYVFEIMGSGGEDEGGVSGPGAVERGPRTISRGHEVELRFLAPLYAYPWFARIADGPSPSSTPTTTRTTPPTSTSPCSSSRIRSTTLRRRRSTARRGARLTATDRARSTSSPSASCVPVAGGPSPMSCSTSILNSSPGTDHRINLRTELNVT